MQLRHFAINPVDVFLYESHSFVLALSHEVVFAHTTLPVLIFDNCSYVLQDVVVVVNLILLNFCSIVSNELVLAQIKATIPSWIGIISMRLLAFEAMGLLRVEFCKIDDAFAVILGASQSRQVGSCIWLIHE